MVWRSERLPKLFSLRLNEAPWVRWGKAVHVPSWRRAVPMLGGNTLGFMSTSADEEGPMRVAARLSATGIEAVRAGCAALCMSFVEVALPHGSLVVCVFFFLLHRSVVQAASAVGLLEVRGLRNVMLLVQRV